MNTLKKVEKKKLVEEFIKTMIKNKNLIKKWDQRVQMILKKYNKNFSQKKPVKIIY